MGKKYSLWSFLDLLHIFFGPENKIVLQWFRFSISEEHKTRTHLAVEKRSLKIETNTKRFNSPEQFALLLASGESSSFNTSKDRLYNDTRQCGLQDGSLHEGRVESRSLHVLIYLIKLRASCNHFGFLLWHPTKPETHLEFRFISIPSISFVLPRFFVMFLINSQFHPMIQLKFCFFSAWRYVYISRELDITQTQRRILLMIFFRLLLLLFLSTARKTRVCVVTWPVVMTTNQ